MTRVLLTHLEGLLRAVDVVVVVSADWHLVKVGMDLKIFIYRIQHPVSLSHLPFCTNGIAPSRNIADHYMFLFGRGNTLGTSQVMFFVVFFKQTFSPSFFSEFIFQEDPNFSSYDYLDSSDILSSESNEGRSDNTPDASVERSEETSKTGSIRIEYRFPESLHVANLSLLSHHQCEAAFNKSIPKYLLCHNASYSGGCSVSMNEFNSLNCCTVFEALLFLQLFLFCF